jgi:hypothetical protein
VAGRFPQADRLAGAAIASVRAVFRHLFDHGTSSLAPSRPQIWCALCWPIRIPLHSAFSSCPVRL